MDNSDIPLWFLFAATVAVAIVGSMLLLAFLENKEESDSDESEEGDSSKEMTAKEKEACKEKKKEREWADTNEQQKYVCNGGKVQCPFANPPMADIVVTSTTIMLQDKPWATVKDKDGKVNFNFTGVCSHPSQQKPPASPPPCKTIISLGEWKDFSETKVGDDNALLVKSTIPCTISGQDIRITDSGQKAELTDVEPKTKQETKSISSIELLRGTTVQTGTVVQYVNISPNIKYVDGTDITEIDGLGQKLRLKVKFDKPGRHKFKVKLTPDPSNVTYSASEKTRNPNFEYSKDEIAFITDSTGEKIIEAGKFFVSPAGGDVFTVSAKDDEGNEVTAAGKIKTERMMYYVEAKMTGLTSVVSNLSPVTGEFAKHGISFKKLPEVSIGHIYNIGNDADSKIFISRIRNAYAASTGPSKDPYCIAIGYTGQLAVKKVNLSIPPVKVTGRSTTPVTIPIVDSAGKKYSLWKNVVPREDWFVECYFIKNGGTIANKVNIDKSKCSPISTPRYAPDNCKSVNIDISALPAETGTIKLKVNCVDYMRGGLSFKETNIVAICTRAWWRNINDNEQCQVIIHEVGHQLGMVANGKGKLPDKTPYHYDSSKGHVGNHCHYDIAAGQPRYDSSTDLANSKCVMYGSTNGKSAFCTECAKALKKVDLSTGV
jgi:hypothetical protein